MDAEIGAAGPELFDTRGILSIPELIAVLDEAKLVVSTDSGPFHIAGGLQKSIVGLFRARRPEHARAYSSANVVFGEDRECEKRCEWNLCRKDPCDQMAQISPETVLNRIGEVLVG
jgi:ADP-heptose:LPS heptosyltransferase